MVAYRRAIVDVDAARLVYVHPQKLAFAGPLEVDELVTQPRQCRFQRLLQVHRLHIPMLCVGLTPLPALTRG